MFEAGKTYQFEKTDMRATCLFSDDKGALVQWGDGSRGYRDNSDFHYYTEVKPKITRWLNVYTNHWHGQLHLTKEAADLTVAVIADRIACIPITFSEGDGL